MEAIYSSEQSHEFQWTTQGYMPDERILHTVTCIAVAREQLGKHVPAKKKSWPTTGKGLSIARQQTCKQPSAGCVTTISDVYC
jgi:hypothetical protein